MLYYMYMFYVTNLLLYNAALFSIEVNTLQLQSTSILCYRSIYSFTLFFVLILVYPYLL